MKTYQLSVDKIGYWLVLLFALASNMSTAVASCAIFGALPFITYKHFRGIEYTRFQKHIMVAMFILFVAFLSTTPFSYNTAESLNRLVGDVTRFIPFFMALCFIKHRKQALLAGVLMGISILVADAVSVWQKMQGAEYATGFDHNHIFFANQLMPMIIMGISLYFSEKSGTKTKWFFGLMALASVGILLLNGSRGVWLALVAVLLLYVILERKRQPKVLPMVGIMIVLSLLLLYFVPELKYRMVTIFDTHYGNNTERVLMIKSAWRIFLDYPIFGVGLDQFHHFYSDTSLYLSPLAKEPGHASPHNNFMTYLAQTGTVGFSAFCSLFFITLKELYKRYKQHYQEWSLIGFFVVIGFLLGGLTDHTFIMINVLRLVWFIVGLGVVCYPDEEV